MLTELKPMEKPSPTARPRFANIPRPHVLERSGSLSPTPGRDLSIYDVWQVEKALWMGGAELRDRHIARDAVAIMPEPFGVLRGIEEFERLHRISPYSEVGFTDRAFTRRRHTVVIAYRAEALHRSTFEPYHALCASTYSWEGGVLQLLSHQQTRVGETQPRLAAVT